MDKALQRLEEIAKAKYTIEDSEYLTDSVDDYDDIDEEDFYDED